MYLWLIVPITIIWTSVVSVDTRTIKHAIDSNNQFSTKDRDDIQSIDKERDEEYYKSYRDEDDVPNSLEEPGLFRSLLHDFRIRRSLGEEIQERVHNALAKRFTKDPNLRHLFKYPSIIGGLKLKPYSYHGVHRHRLTPSRLRNSPAYGRNHPTRTIPRYIPPSPNILPISSPYTYPGSISMPVPEVPSILSEIPNGLLPSKMPSAPYSVSYNDGKSTWNININPGTKLTRRSLVDTDESKEDEEDGVVTSWRYCRDGETCVKSRIMTSWNDDES